MVTSAWFDYNGYMANKLVQVQKAEPAAGWDMAKLVKAFSDAGFADAVGAEKHFEEFGQYEEVAPNAFFNATEYFRAKAAQFYEKAPKAVTDLEVASMQLAIKNAGMSAWSHYEMFGNAEKVNPSNSFDTEAYMNAKLTALNSVKDGKQWTLAELNDAFKNAGLSALEHFMTYGGAGDGEVTQKIVDGKIPTEFAVPEAKKVNSGGSGSGNTYALTTGVDTLVGSGGDDTFNAVLTATDSATYSPGDTVDGNGGKDTFNLTASTNVSSNLASIKGMTDVNLTIATSGAFTADMSDFAGVDTFNVKANAGTVGISGVSKDAVVNVGNLKTVATIGFSDVAGADDTAVVGLTGTTTTAGAIIAGVEKLTLQTVGADSVLGSVTIADTKTLTIAGHDDLTIGSLVANNMKALVIENDEGFVSIKADATTADTLTKVDATKNEGGLFLDLTAQASDSTLSFTGGKGDDTLSMKYTYLTVADSIKGGEGYDTFIIDNPLANTASITTALNKVVSGFEVLAISTSAANTITVSDFTNGITDFLLYGQASDGTATFTDSLSSTKFEIDFSTVSSTGYAKLDVTNKAFETKSDLTIDNQLAGTTTPTATVAAAQFTNVDELSLHSTGNGGTNIVTALTIADGKSLVIDGNVDLTITVANSLKVNAEAFEGDLKLTTASAKDTQIVGGKGDDTITATGGAGSVVFDGKAGGNDTLDVSLATAVATAAASMEMTTFKDADAGDVLKFAGAVTKFEKVAVDVGTMSTLLDALNEAAKDTAVGVIKHFTFGGDTYVVADMSSAASLSTVDVVVKLVGTDIDLSKAIYETTGDTLTFA